MSKKMFPIVIRRKDKIYLRSNVIKIIAFLAIIYVLCQLALVSSIFAGDNDIIIHIVAASSFLAFVFIMLWIYKKLYLPSKKLEQALRSLNSSYNFNMLKNTDVYYSHEMEKTISDFLSLFDSMNAIKMTNVHAEYRALQNQINPHFLYNTLEAIRSDAICQRADSIADIAEALATFFRYTISNISSMVPLEAEISNSETYFAIQNFRFGDRINLKINIVEDDMSILEYKVPKLTLQPIIENAIVHGLERKLGSGTVDIEIVIVDDRLNIKISDDGIGMDEMTLNSINDRLKEVSVKGIIPNLTQEEGIGLVNVNKRLKLQFGEQYGLRVNSIKNFGTSVDITLPLFTNNNR
jgi:two-component system sensor histidine kinase YesM